MSASLQQQIELCVRYGLEPEIPETSEKLGIAIDTLGRQPLNGLRHRPESDTCGWYIWGGENFPGEGDSFSPLHVEHMDEKCPSAIEFLALPPGWRFLSDGEYVDVWKDDSLLEV